jgi:hypothetical protein
MDLSDLKKHLEILGANLAKWPEAEAEAAIELMAESTAAQDLFAKHSNLELDMFGDDADLTDLADHIVDKIPGKDA